MCHIEISKKDIQQFINKQLEGKLQDGIGIMLIGGPGSGKNTIIDHILSSFGFNKTSFVLIDTDPILESLYQNNENCRVSSANHINDILCETAVKGRYNYIYCGTGRNSEYVIEHLIKPSKKHNYTIYLSVILNTIDVAIPRIMKRSLQTDRDTNITFVKDVYSKLEKYMHTYINLDCSLIDGIIIIDNSSNDFKPQVVYTSSCENNIKSVKCYDALNKYQYLTEFCPTLWKDIQRILIHSITIAIINAIVVYYIIMVHKLHWSSILISTAIISYCTASLQHHSVTTQEMILISLLTACAIFFILFDRFNLSQTIGISLLSGIISGYLSRIAR
jgi:predicted ABC-type ATPase